MLKTLFVVTALAVMPAVASAQHTGYTEHTGREIKALDPDRIDALRRGDGLGYALAAELNGYPGPRHLLELADELGLSAAQRDQVQEIFDRMNRAARQLGEALIDGERGLDSLFVKKEITPERLSSRLVTIGNLEARLRGVHLAAHLEVTALLTEQQIMHYQMVRGYADHGEHRP